MRCRDAACVRSVGFCPVKYSWVFLRQSNLTVRQMLLDRAMLSLTQCQSWIKSWMQYLQFCRVHGSRSLPLSNAGGHSLFIPLQFPSPLELPRWRW